MTVDVAEVDQMARLVALMNGTTPPPARAVARVKEGAAPVASVGVDPGIAHMKTILQAFNGAGSGMETVTRSLVRESKSDVELRSAMMTQQTTNGVRIGDWQIVVKPDGKRKFYDVVGLSEGTAIATDLTLYEAAYGLAHALAEGKPITSPLVRSILQNEGDYASALSDAIHFRHALSKPRALRETARFEVIEDRYEAAKHKAAVAKARLVDVVGPLPF